MMITINENSLHIAEEAISNLYKEVMDKYGEEKGAGIILLIQEMGMYTLAENIPAEALAHMHAFIASKLNQKQKDWTVTLG